MRIARLLPRTLHDVFRAIGAARHHEGNVAAMERPQRQVAARPCRRRIWRHRTSHVIESRNRDHWLAGGSGRWSTRYRGFGIAHA